MHIQAIAWDIDGTLLDSEPLYNQAICYASQQLGVDSRQLDPAQLAGLHMPDVWQLLAAQSPHGPYAQWLSLLEDYYLAHVHTLPINDHSSQLIACLSQRQIRQACVSNSTPRIVAANLQHLAITAHLEFVISLHDVQQGKPAPEPYLLACEKFQLAPQSILAVEDSITGLCAAHAAQLNVVHYAVLPTAPHTLHHRISHLKQILQLID
jgi:HAD superfamily hydrolase (TIGR01509 family)